jgi:hypothetical protein
MPAGQHRWRAYTGGMVLRSPPHAVYDTLSHVGWSPQDRRDGWPGEGQRRGPDLCTAIAAP